MRGDRQFLRWFAAALAVVAMIYVGAFAYLEVVNGGGWLSGKGSIWGVLF